MSIDYREKVVVGIGPGETLMSKGTKFYTELSDAA
jgi:hypothetical protein